MAEIAGVDFAWSKPDPAATVNAGYHFVLGYLSHDPSKDLLGPQLAAYRNAGLLAGLVWETGANAVLGGAAAGAADGASAENQANLVGYAPDAPIFFAVDFDAQPYQFPTIAAYGQAFNAGTRRPVGIYGSFSVVEHFVSPGQQPVQYGWQTAAWSGGQLSAKAHIYQRNSHVWPIIPGTSATSFDEDILCIPLPLMGAGSSPPPSPTPPAPPPPWPFDVRSWRVQFGDSSLHVKALQDWGNRTFPLYCNIHPTDPHYGPLTAGFVREFAHRSGIPEADGMNIGPKVAGALANAGFGG